jgi:hypothetical protein
VSPRAAARLAWSLCGVSVALVAGGIAFTVLNWSYPQEGDFIPELEVLLAVALLAFPVVGAVVVSRRPENSIGWLFCAVGIPFGMSGMAHGWGVYALFVEPGSLPGGEVAAWLANWLFVPPLFAIPPLLFLLFPDGRPLTRRWRFAVWLVPIAICATTLGSALAPGPLDELPFTRVENPVGVEGASAAMEVASAVGFIALFFAILFGAVSLVLRFRRARGDERQQLKWFASSAGLFALACIVALTPFMPGDSDALPQLLILLTFAAIPVAAGVAILRHRLYDIDVVIRRTLIYAVLTATLAACYLAGVLLLQLALGPLTEDNDLAIAGSTLAAAALFRPARARIQALVDRRFYRHKYDAAHTIESFGTRLRDEVELDAILGDLRGVVADTMQPAHVSLWLRNASGTPPA